jgi:AcrR family transcriptional regulator
MRKKDQRARREQLARAARDVLIDRGAVGARVKDVAERAGLSPSSVLYYYPEIEELLLEVSRDATERYAERRAAAVRLLADPARQMRLAIHLGVPDGPDDEESRLLYQIDAFTGSSRVFGLLTSSFFDRQVALYEAVLGAGSAAGAFSLAASENTIARGIVALEDGLGLQVVVGHPRIDNPEAERILLRHAGAMIGVDLEAVPLAQSAASSSAPPSAARMGVAST